MPIELRSAQSQEVKPQITGVEAARDSAKQKVLEDCRQNRGGFKKECEAKSIQRPDGGRTIMFNRPPTEKEVADILSGNSSQPLLRNSDQIAPGTRPGVITGGVPITPGAIEQPFPPVQPVKPNPDVNIGSGARVNGPVIIQGSGAKINIGTIGR